MQGVLTAPPPRLPQPVEDEADSAAVVRKRTAADSDITGQQLKGITFDCKKRLLQILNLPLAGTALEVSRPHRQVTVCWCVIGFYLPTPAMVRVLKRLPLVAQPPLITRHFCHCLTSPQVGWCLSPYAPGTDMWPCFRNYILSPVVFVCQCRPWKTVAGHMPRRSDVSDELAARCVLCSATKDCYPGIGISSQCICSPFLCAAPPKKI